MNAKIQSSVSNTPSFLRSVKTVAWSFLGIRKKSEFQDDLAQVSPLHILMVAVVAVLVFVVSLMFFVKWVVTF